jgi:orotate phosphoribosyltransferase
MGDIPGKPWPKDFPRVTTLVNYNMMKRHPDYGAAKSGDNESAVRLISVFMGKENDKIFIELAKKYPNAILLGIHAEEETGKNKIPQVLADYISRVTGLETDGKILQSNIVSHTGAGQNVRLFNRPEFDGEVQKGRDYILIDDMVTMGGTFGELRHYIESRGGNVVNMISMSTQHENNKTIAPTDKTMLDLEKTFGIKLGNGNYDMSRLNDFLKESEMYGGNYEALTESEARALIHIKTIDEAGNRRSSARQAGNVHICPKEI